MISLDPNVGKYHTSWLLPQFAASSKGRANSSFLPIFLTSGHPILQKETYRKWTIDANHWTLSQHWTCTSNWHWQRWKWKRHKTHRRKYKWRQPKDCWRHPNMNNEQDTPNNNNNNNNIEDTDENRKTNNKTKRTFVTKTINYPQDNGSKESLHVVFLTVRELNNYHKDDHLLVNSDVCDHVFDTLTL